VARLSVSHCLAINTLNGFGGKTLVIDLKSPSTSSIREILFCANVLHKMYSKYGETHPNFLCQIKVKPSPPLPLAQVQAHVTSARLPSSGQLGIDVSISTETWARVVRLVFPPVPCPRTHSPPFSDIKPTMSLNLPWLVTGEGSDGLSDCRRLVFDGYATLPA